MQTRSCWLSGYRESEQKHTIVHTVVEEVDESSDMDHQSQQHVNELVGENEEEAKSGEKQQLDEVDVMHVVNEVDEADDAEVINANDIDNLDNQVDHIDQMIEVKKEKPSQKASVRPKRRTTKPTYFFNEHAEDFGKKTIDIEF